MSVGVGAVGGRLRRRSGDASAAAAAAAAAVGVVAGAGQPRCHPAFWPVSCLSGGLYGCVWGEVFADMARCGSGWTTRGSCDALSWGFSLTFDDGR